MGKCKLYAWQKAFIDEVIEASKGDKRISRCYWPKNHGQTYYNKQLEEYRMRTNADNPWRQMPKDKKERLDVYDLISYGVLEMNEHREIRSSGKIERGTNHAKKR